MEHIEILYNYMASKTNISRADFDIAMNDWQLDPVELSGEVVGCVMTKGNEIHIAAEPKHFGRWAARTLSRKYLINGIERYGYLVTKVFPHNEDFVQRLGFYKTGIDGSFITYRIDHAKIH